MILGGAGPLERHKRGQVGDGEPTLTARRSSISQPPGASLWTLPPLNVATSDSTAGCVEVPLAASGPGTPRIRQERPPADRRGSTQSPKRSQARVRAAHARHEAAAQAPRPAPATPARYPSPRRGPLPHRFDPALRRLPHRARSRSRSGCPGPGRDEGDRPIRSTRTTRPECSELNASSVRGRTPRLDRVGHKLLEVDRLGRPRDDTRPSARCRGRQAPARLWPSSRSIARSLSGDSSPARAPSWSPSRTAVSGPRSSWHARATRLHPREQHSPHRTGSHHSRTRRHPAADHERRDHESMLPSTRR